MCERLKFETGAYDQGFECIVGLDEAGRGPMAGPLVVAGVVFPKDFYDDRINDSKQLSEKKRESLYDLVIEHCIAYSIQIIEVEEVDELNVYQASRIGMIRAIEDIIANGVKIDYALTDAMPLGDVIAHEAIVKGDAKSMSIGGASILAKVTRDRLMLEYDKVYPKYGFKKHKGYPTKMHKDALKEFGVSPIHRRSFKPVMDVLNEQLSLDI